ncbi:MAG: virulence RhuM family protein [Candidatus Caenarcaniphilales bacterium]|nr:virulence RhuM family protein [Candidatus Caenarcaniphilales bacterium]
MSKSSNEVIIYQSDDGKTNISVKVEDETVWLNMDQMAQLFNKSKSTINEHIINIYEEQELEKEGTLRKIGNPDFSTKPTNHYNLDVIISVGYRVKSIEGTRFRQWATQRLKEYIVKGFTMDDERLKGFAGGNYWKELLDRIRDIRSSEKVLYRQVLDLYATSIDYDPKSEESIKFFKTVQNKLHYAVNRHTAAETIYLRADAEKEFMGLTSFAGEVPVKAETKIAKNYLDEDELFRLDRMVSAFFDLAELKAQEHTQMKMENWVEELDKFTEIYGKGKLQNAGKVSHKDAMDKAESEYKKYQAKTLSPVEKAYLETIKGLEKKVLKKDQKKGDK